MPVQCLNCEKFTLIGHLRGKESKPLDSKVYTQTSAIRVGIRLMLQLETYHNNVTHGDIIPCTV